MKRLLVCIAFLAGQMGTLQDKPVVRLQPHQLHIQANFGGDLLELINSPTTIQLPKEPPTLDSQGNQWSVDVKNLGPGAVTVVSKPRFSVQVNVGQTVQIKWTGSGYSLTR